MKIKKIALAVSALLISSGALAHGYIEAPQSRAYKCHLTKDANNPNCGQARYEPQSIEQRSGFPGGPLPLDGKLASGGIPSFSPLDRQSSNVWEKNVIKPGMNDFTWHHTAQHKTTNWRYYITKQNWDQNQPLTRDAFESTPFCQVDGQGEAPPILVTHQCDVPQHTGYQVIYGVWEIADTINSFYQVIDVNFSNDESIPSEWNNQLPGLVGGKNLQLGDKVVARFFDAQGEVLAKRTEMTIATKEQEDNNRWSYDLANQINNANSDIRVGVKDSQGNVNPAYGNNRAFVKKDSRLNRVVISYEEETPEITEDVNVSNVQATKIDNRQATLSFNAQVSGAVSFEGKVIDHHGSEKGYLKQDMQDSTQTFSVILKDVVPGHHMFKYFATNKQGVLIKQDVINLQLENAGDGNTGEYQYIFPENFKSYVAGTVVLQPKDGKTYQCKPFPYSGYCTQWASTETQFEPGVGSNWQDAWTLK